MEKYLLLSFLKNILRSLSFVSHGREGEVIYNEGLKQIRFYMEFGGGDVVFYLTIPNKAEWEERTGFSLSKREAIINFVAKGTLEKQAPSCLYKINENDIVFYNK